MSINQRQDTTQNSEHEIIKPGCWSIGKQNNIFYVEFLSGEMAGRLIKFNISEVDFNKALNDEISLSTLKKEYNISG